MTTERRRSPRMRPKGTVRVSGHGDVIQGRLANVSAGGMRVDLDVALPASVLDQDLTLELRLDGPDAGWIEITGRVVRMTGTAIALSFQEVPPAFDELVRRETMSSLENGHYPKIVLVDNDDTRRHPIAGAFRSAGFHVVEAASPLEAIVRVGESSYEPKLIAIADSIPPEVAEELRTFMRRHHPRARLITIGHGDGPELDTDWLGSSDEDLRSRIRRLLGRAS